MPYYSWSFLLLEYQMVWRRCWFDTQGNRSLQTAQRGVTLCKGSLLCGRSAETYFPAGINAASVLFWVPWWYKYRNAAGDSWSSERGTVTIVIWEIKSDNLQRGVHCPGAAWANWATSIQLEGSWRVTDGASAESRAWNHLDPQQGTKVLLLCQTQSGFHGYATIAHKYQWPGDNKGAAKGQSSDCFRWLGRWEPSSRCDPLPGPPVTRRGGSGHQRGYLPTTCRDSDHFHFNFEDKEYLPQLRPSYSGTSKNQWLKFRLR